MCFNDATDLCCLARLGVNGTIRQIGGQNEKNNDDIWNGPKRRVPFAIFEIVWGKAIPRGAFAASERGYFSRESPQEYEEMCRARMTTTRVCVYHADNAEASVVHQGTIIGRDANKMCYQKAGQQLNCSYGMRTFQFWLDRIEGLMDRYFKTQVPDTVRDMNIRQFHSMPFLDLMELKEKLETVVDVPPEVLEETQYVSDCCTLTFFEFGLSMLKFMTKNVLVIWNTITV